MTGYVAWTCNGCRDMHYMREPMYAGGLCRQCADPLGLDDPVDADDLRRVAADDGDPHRWNGLTYEDDPSPFSEATPPKDRTPVGGWYLGRRGYLGRLR